MKDFNNQPFRVEKFKTEGGGIDFLGMRQVNLSILQQFLVPGINNATSDIGTYCIATWIPWKFWKLTEATPELATDENYRQFQEAVEVAMAHVTRDESPSAARLGLPRRRMGTNQKVDEETTLSFESADRGPSTSLFAAPLYGPSLRFLKLLGGNAMAADGVESTKIPVVMPDDDTEAIATQVEQTLSRSSASVLLTKIGIELSFNAVDIDDLDGLNPAAYRQRDSPTKSALFRKFFESSEKQSQTWYRWLTARLICRTVEATDIASLDQLRQAWHTGLLPSGQPLVIESDAVAAQRENWSVLISRQIQRTIQELLLQQFEIALGNGCNSINKACDHLIRRLPDEKQSTFEESLHDQLLAYAAPLASDSSLDEISLVWQTTIHGSHESYEDRPSGDESFELIRIVEMLSGWWLRYHNKLENARTRNLIEDGGRNRMSAAWFHRWVQSRMNLPLRELLIKLFEETVFAQHLRVALNRFDGEVQRLRFTTGDDGIIPSTSVGKKLGSAPARMADRLKSFLGLLQDLEIMEWPKGSPMTLGPNAERLEEVNQQLG